MNGYEAFKKIKVPPRVFPRDTHTGGKLLLQKVRAVRIEIIFDDMASYELAAKLIGTSSLAVFPQDRGKMIYTNAEETPSKVRRLPGFVWVKVKRGISIGFSRNRVTIKQKQRLNEYLRERRPAIRVTGKKA